MRRLSLLAVSLIGLAVATLPARADFIKDSRQWKQLGPDGQAAYAMAIVDVMTVMVNDDKFVAARAIGLRVCARALHLNAAMVAQAITQFYVDHPEAQEATPFVAFNGYFERGACSPFINEARRQMNLPPMKAAPLPKAQPDAGQQQ